MKAVLLAALAAASFFLMPSPGEARNHQPAVIMDNNGHYRPVVHKGRRHARHRVRRHHRTPRHRVRHVYRAKRFYRGSRRIIGSRPPGCPPAYCGCGLARFLGLRGSVWNLAWNWARLLPHTHARAGAVAVRRHHVMLLVAHRGGHYWQVRNYNGWRHLSYIETRNVRGYLFVDPRRRMARR